MKTPWNDWKNIVGKLTFLRLFNLIQLKSSFGVSRILKRAIVWGKPYAVSIEPTTACNLACPECPSGLKQFTRATGKLSLDMNRKMLDELGMRLFYINYYFQGEPFLNPQFLELVREAKKRNIYTATSTNAHFIDAKKANEIVTSGLDRLIISIDGLTQETYSNYRVNGSLEKVITATKHLVKAKKEAKSQTPHLIFQFLVVKQNEHEIKNLYQLAEELQVDEVRLKSAQVYDYKHGNPLIPDNLAYSRYKKQKDGTYSLKVKTGNHCWRMWSSCVLTWDGKLVPCCFDKDAQHPLGDVKLNSFKEVWKGKTYNEFRRAVLVNRNEIDICSNCSEGAKVWV